MEYSRILKPVLFVSGLIATGVGGLILVAPEILYAASGIELGRNISQFSEVRASGGALSAGGVLIMSGAFISRLAFTSAVVSTVLYLSYGVSRVLSMAIDGMPSDGLVQAAVLEMAIGLAGVFVLVKHGVHDRARH